jgi:hypothetical protein
MVAEVVAIFYNKSKEMMKMKIERTPITIRLQSKLHSKLQAIQEETGLSQTKVIEMLIDGYGVQPKVQPVAEMQPYVDEESILAKLQSKMQASIEEELARVVATKSATIDEERINNIVHRKLVEIGAIYEDEDEDCYVAPVISDEDRYRDELARIDEMNRVLSPEEVRAIIDGMDE